MANKIIFTKIEKLSPSHFSYVFELYCESLKISRSFKWRELYTGIGI